MVRNWFICYDISVPPHAGMQMGAPMPPMGYQGHQMPPNVSQTATFIWLNIKKNTRERKTCSIARNHNPRASLFNLTKASHSSFVAPHINFGSLRSIGEPSGLQQWPPASRIISTAAAMSQAYSSLIWYPSKVPLATKVSDIQQEPNERNLHQAKRKDKHFQLAFSLNALKQRIKRQSPYPCAFDANATTCLTFRSRCFWTRIKETSWPSVASSSFSTLLQKICLPFKNDPVPSRAE